MSKYEKLWRCIGNCSQEEITLTFAQIGEIAGAPIDHSFLQHKKELTAYGWEVSKISMKKQMVLFMKARK